MTGIGYFDRFFRAAVFFFGVLIRREDVLPAFVSSLQDLASDSNSTVVASSSARSMTDSLPASACVMLLKAFTMTCSCSLRAMSVDSAVIKSGATAVREISGISGNSAPGPKIRDFPDFGVFRENRQKSLIGTLAGYPIYRHFGRSLIS